MIVNNASSTAAFSPSSTVEFTKSNAQSMVSNARNSLSSVPSAIVQLSTKGQMISLADRPGSMGENNESASKESTESASVQFQEGEIGGRTTPQPSLSPAIAAYAKMAMQ